MAANSSTDGNNQTVVVKSSEIWDYEAPQYCDFSDTQTFADNPEVDNFFLTNHESKENISSEGFENGIDSSDSDVFQTPMSIREDKRISAISVCSSDYFSPKSVKSNTSVGTPVATLKSGYPLRQTPLRNLYQNGATPLHVPGPTPKSFGSRKSSKKNQNFGPAKSVSFENDKKSAILTPSKRETFDVVEVAEKLEELTVSVEVTQEIPEKTTAGKIDSSNYNEDEDEKLNQTVCENKENVDLIQSENKEESVADVNRDDGNEEVANVEFHTITDQELQEKVGESNNSLLANTSRRSSYVVRSPSVRVVHFNEESIVNKLDTIGEDGQLDQVTPTLKATSEQNKKIKSRQQTPMAGPSTSINGTKKKAVTFNFRLKKYIKRFSKTSTKEGGEKDEIPQVKTITEDKKKRVTISAPKATNNTTVIKAKRNISLKPSFSFARNSAKANSLARSKSFAQPRPSTSTTVANSSETSANSPYLGLAVLNKKFMDSVRHHSPVVATKPKVTVPKAPHLMTEQRMTIRKFHTMPSLQSTSAQKIVPPPKVKKSIVPKPVPSKATPSEKHVTKAISPHFSTDARLKVWHLKHDGPSQVDGSTQSTQEHTFKARPVPDFKKLQAHEQKRKKEALEKAKQIIRTSKMPPFSFESRAHSSKPQHQ